MMGERLQLALRPWTYSEIGVLWFALLGLMVVSVVLQSVGRVRAAHHLMAAAGAALTARLVWHVVSHYARCGACSLVFDLSPNPSSWAFLYDYLCCGALFAMFGYQEARRFRLGSPARVAAAMALVPTVAAPWFFARLHEAEQDEKRAVAGVPSWRWPFAIMVVVSAPFVMPALPFDHFGALGGEFFWDGTSNQLNSYVAMAILLIFGQVFLFTLPRTRGFGLKVASLFLAFNCIAAYFALFAALYDGRRAGGARRHPFVRGGAGAMIGAIFLGNMAAALFGVTLRFTHFIIKAPETVCVEGLVTRARELPACVGALESVTPAREARAAAPGASSLDRALPDETRAALGHAREALQALARGDARAAGAATRRLGAQHGSDLPACQDAASANYAVLNECPE